MNNSQRRYGVKKTEAMGMYHWYDCIMRWAPFLQAAGKSDEHLSDEHLNADGRFCMYQYSDVLEDVNEEEADNFKLA